MVVLPQALLLYGGASIDHNQLARAQTKMKSNKRARETRQQEEASPAKKMKPNLQPLQPLGNDIWNNVFKFCEASTLAKTSRLNKHCNSTSNLDKYWQVLVFKRWPYYFALRHKTGKNWKQQFATKHTQERNWQAVYFELVDRNKGDANKIEKDISINFLENVEQLEKQYNAIYRAVNKKLEDAGLELEGSDSALDMMNYILSCGKKTHDAIMKNARAWLKKQGQLDHNEMFAYIWQPERYETDHLDPIVQTLNATLKAN